MSDITVNNFKAFYEQIRPYLGAAHSGFTPIGTVISVMGTTAPLNYLACDGTVYNISDYTELAAYFNQQFGSSNFFGGDGTTTFAVPDLRGEFLRGTGTNSHANQGSGAAVGEHQDGTRHPNLSTSANAAQGYLIATGSSWPNVINPDNIKDSDFDFTYSGAKNTRVLQNSGDFTSRPTNTSVLYCIASKNIFMDAGSNYSTEEQVVGTWIDGKPIYQKTINLGILPSQPNTEKRTNHGISNLGYIISGELMCYATINSIKYNLPIPYTQVASNDSLTWWADQTNIILLSQKDTSFATSYATIRYTKTAD